MKILFTRWSFLAIAFAIFANESLFPVPHQKADPKLELLEIFDPIVQYLQTVEQDIIEGIQTNGNESQESGKNTFNFDVTLVGFVNFADGIGRHPILFKECMTPSIKMNFLSTRDDVDPELEDAQLGLPRLNKDNPKDIGAIAILTDILGDKEKDIYKRMPNSCIKIAYTMFESTEIPYNWVSVLNNNFDMAVVPDPFLIDVYENCGVQIPIFVLPLPLMLNDFLKIRRQTVPHNPFVFGFSGGFWSRKNHIRVLEAFAAEFGNRNDVRLKLHGRFGEGQIIKEINDTIKKYHLRNVDFIVKQFDWSEYIKFIKSIDCGVFLSMGEGFSIVPRELLACGKPCIVTDNTGQSTICNSGFVRTVPSNVLIPAIYDCHYVSKNIPQLMPQGNIQDILKVWNSAGIEDLISADEIENLSRSINVGYQFDCSIEDAREAMRDVFMNYNSHLKLATKGRRWVKQYLMENLRSKYISMVKPAAIILGKENVIGDNFFMTNSRTLYEKYRHILGK